MPARRKPQGDPPPRDADDAVRDAVVDLIGPDEAELPVLHLLTSAGSPRMVAGVHTLDAQQIVTISLDGPYARPTTTEDP